MSKSKKTGKLEEGLLQALQALDSQIARRMERSPGDREIHGVQKWEPYQAKLEETCSVVLNAVADQEVTLDGVLVLAQAFTKSLYLLVEELGSDGLGDIRSAYTKSAFEAILRDANLAKEQLSSGAQLN